MKIGYFEKEFRENQLLWEGIQRKSPTLRRNTERRRTTGMEKQLSSWTDTWKSYYRAKLLFVMSIEENAIKRRRYVLVKNKADRSRDYLLTLSHVPVGNCSNFWRVSVSVSKILESKMKSPFRFGTFWSQLSVVGCHFQIFKYSLYC